MHEIVNQPVYIEQHTNHNPSLHLLSPLLLLFQKDIMEMIYPPSSSLIEIEGK